MINFQVPLHSGTEDDNLLLFISQDLESANTLCAAATGEIEESGTVPVCAPAEIAVRALEMTKS